MNKNEIAIVQDFLKENDHLDKNDFEYKLNRYFLYVDNKPKRWKEILETLSIINSKYSRGER